VPKVVKKFSLTASAEGFTEVGSSADIGAEWVAGDGDPAGCMRFFCTTPSISGNEQFRGPAETWEAWGVPPGSTVHAVMLTNNRHRRPVGSGISGTAEFRAYVLNGANASAVTDANGIYLATLAGTPQLGWSTLTAAGVKVVSAANRPSNSTVKFQFWITFSTGAGPVDLDFRFDEMELTIWYDLASVTKTFSWAADAEGFVDGGNSAEMTASFEPADGNPAGCAKFAAASSGSGTTERFQGPEGGTTWEAWGVPANSEVLIAQVPQLQFRRAANGDGNEIFVIDVVNGTTGAGVVMNELGALLNSGVLPGAGLTTWAAWTTGAAERSISNLARASNSTVRLRPAATTGATANPVDLRMDEIQLKIWYEPNLIPIAPDFHNPPSDNYEPAVNAARTDRNQLLVEVVQADAELGTHLVAGQQVEVRVWMIRTDTGVIVPLAAGGEESPFPPRFAVFRATAAGTYEYLANDGTWHDVASDGPIYFHLPAQVGGTEVWAKTLNTAGWNGRDLLVVASGYRLSIEYHAQTGREVVGPANRHDRYAFDPTGLFK